MLLRLSAPNAAVVVTHRTSTIEVLIGRTSSLQEAFPLIGWIMEFDIQHWEFIKRSLQGHVTGIGQHCTKYS